MTGKVQNLKRMKARLAGEADASVEIPFELTCECGEVVRGIRRTRGIQKQCEQCGETLFVLPMNVYPATKSVKSEVIGGGFRDRLKVVVTEIFPAKKKKPTQPPARLTNSDTTTAAENAAVPAAANAAQVAEPPKRKPFKIPRIDFRKVARQTFTPFRLVIIAMICVVGFTGFWLVQQQAKEAARQVWLTSVDQIELLLSEGKTVDLESQLKETVAAGRVLAKSDEEWRRTFNLYQEAKAINRLAASDLLTAFHGAYDKSGQLSDSGLGEIRNASTSGVFVFDTFLRPDVNNEGFFLFEIPAAPGHQPVTGAVGLPQLQKFLDAIPDQRILFAASVDSVVAPDRQRQLSWRIELAPASLVLLTSTELCESLGLSVDDEPELADILDRQQGFVRQTETWESRADDRIPEKTGLVIERPESLQ